MRLIKNSQWTIMMSISIIIANLIFCSKTDQIATQTSTTAAAKSISDREYICAEFVGKSIIDVWSIKDSLLYIRLAPIPDAPRNGSKRNEFDDIVRQRLLVYDIIGDKLLKILHPYDQRAIAKAQSSNTLSDIIAVRILSSAKKDSSSLWKKTLSPSPIYFDTRSELREQCHANWFYDPPNSAFCRRHPVINDLGRVLCVVNGANFSNYDKVDFDLYRASLTSRRTSASRGSEKFATTSIDTVPRVAARSVRDTLGQLFSTSILSLQLSNPDELVRQTNNIRFLFSNKLGLLISWIAFDDLRARQSNSSGQNNLKSAQNCAIFLSVKLTPTIHVCSRVFRFVAFAEFRSTIFVLTTENRVLQLSHKYLTKEYRIYNNLDIDLDQSTSLFVAENFWHQIFRCPIMV